MKSQNDAVMMTSADCGPRTIERQAILNIVLSMVRKETGRPVPALTLYEFVPDAVFDGLRQSIRRAS